MSLPTFRASARAYDDDQLKALLVEKRIGYAHDFTFDRVTFFEHVTGEHREIARFERDAVPQMLAACDELIAVREAFEAAYAAQVSPPEVWWLHA